MMNFGTKTRIIKMNNTILRILLKSFKDRSISEQCELINFYRSCSNEEFRYAYKLEFNLNGKNNC